MIAAAVDAAHGPPPVVIAFVSSSPSRARPSGRRSPRSCRRSRARPKELTASNVTASAIESACWFAGPAIGGLVVAASGTVAGFLFAAGCLARLGPVHPPHPARARRRSALPKRARGCSRMPPTALKAIAQNRGLALLVGLFAAQTFVSGALGVLNVVLAKSVLGGGAAQVGYLNAAMGLGGVVGSVGSVGLVGSRRLATMFGVGILFWGIPLIVIGAKPELVLAIVLYLALGFGNTLADVAGYTLMQRAVPDRVLARVTGRVRGDRLPHARGRGARRAAVRARGRRALGVRDRRPRAAGRRLDLVARAAPARHGAGRPARGAAAARRRAAGVRAAAAAGARGDRARARRSSISRRERRSSAPAIPATASGSSPTARCSSRRRTGSRA